MIHQFSKKFNAQNISKFSKKIVQGAHVFGRKFKNTLHTIGEIGGKALPIVETVAGTAGFPELGGAIHQHVKSVAKHYRLWRPLPEWQDFQNLEVQYMQHVRD